MADDRDKEKDASAKAPKFSNRPDNTTARRTRMLRKIKIEDEYLKKMADEIAAEKRRLTMKREHLATILREREAEGT
ncbi:unnamed protein product [Heligmosomoides polygyrus]|uniref:Transcriptional regulator n=1 Tax=Heligmosomoides polygyrus TaxID=6339 RepID=A0A183FT44_HELPZ|nr:unnamed protein product [Heligmosomoides polygyrus]